jgi:ribosome maturation factor RimP
LVSLQEIVSTTVTGLGYELIELERSAGGLLRVTIDLPWTPESEASALGSPMLTVEDCEKVTRQLQFTLEVETIEYRRLEVSSPGIDRPLRNQQDFERFCGETIDITLKQPMGVAAQGMVNASRKKFRGELRKGPASGEWQIAWVDEPASAKAARPAHKDRAMVPKAGKKKKEVIEQVMGFVLGELREARLAPIVNFKGRQQPGTVPDKPQD